MKFKYISYNKIKLKMSKKCAKCKKELDMKRFTTEDHYEPYACCNDCRIKLVSQKNKCKTCGIHAVFNFQGEKIGVFCAKHREPNMVDIKHKTCKEVNCSKRPTYNFKGEITAIFCNQHREPNMVDIKHKTCQKDDCPKRPTYNFEGEMKPIFCKDHRAVDMIDVENKKCQADKCLKRPNFNTKGSKTPKFCSDHKEPGMVDVKNKKCQEDGCEIQPTFNIIGSKTPKFCSEHKKVDMINVRDKFCIADGCSKIPSFNIRGSKTAKFCKEHKESDMVDITHKRCQEDGCQTQPTFNMKGSIEAKFCRIHKKDGMIDVIHKTCQYDSCTKRPIFNIFGDSKGIFCEDHKTSDMVDVTNKKCEEKGCRKRPSYGLPGNQITHCITHKKQGMTTNPRKKCEDDECKETAIFGIKDPIHCEEHSNENEYNLAEHPCKKCKKIDVLNREGLCVNFCSLEERDHIMKKMIKKHEEFVNRLLDEEIDLKPFSKDESPDRECTKKRPDRVYHLGTHIVIIEIDEDQHKSYKCTAYGDKKEGRMKAENIRMYEISQSYDFLPCIWLRYNPDSFKDGDGKLAKFSTSKRHDLLVKWVKKCLRDVGTKGVKVKYLFYDGFVETDSTFTDLNI